ncbi:MAG TPA: hypothetical protein VMB79_03045 [Jatrophihabitans sp.]|nr:hypothetical protein [Jatrophihabitans sp.]
MRLLARLSALSTAGLLGLGTVLGVGGVAAAAPLPNLGGSAPAAAHGPATITYSYTVTLPSAVDATVFTTRQDAAVPAATTGVLLDGVAVPAGQVSRPSSIDIAVQTGASPADGLAAGTHTFSFTSTIGSAVSADTSSTATLSWTRSGVPGSVTSAPVAVAVNAPDVAVALTPGSGEDQVGFLGTGQDVVLAVDVANLGYGNPHATLHLLLPAGMRLGSDGISRDGDGSSLTCTADPADSHRISCPLGVLVAGSTADPTLDLDLTTEPNEPIGSLATVTVSAEPDPGEGTDSNPANNAVSAQVEYTGSARLDYTVHAASNRVPVGSRTTVRLTVHNAGPQAAPSTIAFGVVVGDQFEITGFSGRMTPPAGQQKASLNTARLGRIVSSDSLAAGATDAGTGGSAVLWFAGDIPAGQSVSATLTITARTPGTAQVGILAISGAADPNCLDFECDPTTATVTAVAVPAKPGSGEGPASGGGTQVAGGLADTGASTRPALLGLAMLLAGAGLLLLARRRSPA